MVSSPLMQRSEVDFPQPEADQADHLMLLDLQRQALEHLVLAEALVDVADLDQGHVAARL